MKSLNKYIMILSIITTTFHANAKSDYSTPKSNSPNINQSQFLGNFSYIGQFSTSSSRSIALNSLVEEFSSFETKNHQWIEQNCKVIYRKLIELEYETSNYSSAPSLWPARFRTRYWAKGSLHCYHRSYEEKAVLSLQNSCSINPVEVCFEERIISKLNAITPTKFVNIGF